MNFFLTTLGFTSTLAGIYLWLGLPATLILFGLALMYTAVRLEITDNEPAQSPDTVP